jgi:hypothetical protein
MRHVLSIGFAKTSRHISRRAAAVIDLDQGAYSSTPIMTSEDLITANTAPPFNGMDNRRKRNLEPG